MSMYVNLHTKTVDRFEIEAHVTNDYPVVQITTQRGENLQEFTLFSTPAQLEKLVDHIRHVLDELENSK